MGAAGPPLLCPLPLQQVQRPRLLICGEEGSGQSHLGPALLYALEGLPVHALGLPSLLSDASARSVLFLIMLLYHNFTLTDRSSMTQAELPDSKSAFAAVLIVALEAQQAPAEHLFVLSYGLELWQWPDAAKIAASTVMMQMSNLNSRPTWSMSTKLTAMHSLTIPYCGLSLNLDCHNVPKP